ncbi:MAG: class I poly(R)-hydroxyalkanoic acid synthase [Rhodospirillaceae bacterium]|nr:class I poly(R)-hydroxyalkanoic acid synthase [Rhodospirillaceae bacterium]
MGPTSETYGVVNSESVAELSMRFQRIISEYFAKQMAESSLTDLNSGSHLGNAFIELTAKMMANPAKLAENQLALWQDYLNLWTASSSRMMGGESPVDIQPEPEDRRFGHESWNENDVFNFIKQSYLLTANWLTSVVGDVEGMDDKTARKVNFYTRQFVNALSPSNFIATNPEVISETFETGGENLVNGIENLLDDLEQSKGQLRITMSDEASFKLGENIATTPGKVVYRNDLVELIQYAPTTKKVFKTPLLIITPWINKYYILDLRPQNSLIKWATDQGHTVFVTSWVNPDESFAGKTFDDYMQEGILDSLTAINKATGEVDCNAIGYCIGGTLLAATLAYMAAVKDTRIKSATFLSTLVDFADPGDLGVFIDKEQLDDLDEMMFERGYLDGTEMASTFNMMRDNDLIWSFVVNNYMLGKAPFPFDLLYWNSDSTRMPAAMHSFYLRKMYLENKLVEPGGIELSGVPIDLRQIKIPIYMLSTRDDHIAPWKSTYKATALYSGPLRFVLAGSGHIAGVVNPPAKEKYGYWTNSKTPKNPDTWLKSAKQTKGSWWPDWADWIKKQAGKKDVAPRKPGTGKLKALEDAPGSYVRVR